ncbi:hypothetical protein F4680DRAFT_176146 [Xylaria scruposa]|nr:hypothetical protein F4680DRAFT_176146 [Xylaria scruposa]
MDLGGCEAKAGAGADADATVDADAGREGKWEDTHLMVVGWFGYTLTYGFGVRDNGQCSRRDVQSILIYRYGMQWFQCRTWWVSKYIHMYPHPCTDILYYLILYIFIWR